jgi:hypothetical protein
MSEAQNFKVISGSRRPPPSFYSAELLRQQTLEPRPFNHRKLKEMAYRAMMRYFAHAGIVKHADGLFYLDTREPHLVSDIGAVTMTTTAKALYPAAAFPVLGGQYFNRPGKSIKICMWLKFTLGATPGNLSFNVHWGTGADANGTLICVAGTPVAATNATGVCYVEVTVRCLTTGTAGTLQATGMAIFDVALVASPNFNYFFPKAGAAASAGLDLTAANIVSVQVLQSGTAATVQCQELKVIALN